MVYASNYLETFALFLVYFALGLASYELFGDFDFDRYFMDNLLKELSNSSAGYALL